MSYKKRKIKKGRLSRLKYKFVQIKSALLGRVGALLHEKRRKGMRLQQTQKVMEALRSLNRGAARNNKRIDEWVDSYVNDCILNGRPVEILTEWCSGFGLAERQKRQGGRFIPLPAETDLVQKQMPRIVRIFTEQGVKVSWIITFNRSYIERRRLPDNPFFAYVRMIKDLASGVSELDESVMFLDWDELSGKIEPNQEILTKFDTFVSKNAIEYELRTFLQMLKQYPDALVSEDDLTSEAKRRIAFESEEARYLAEPGESPFNDGRFILIPLEKPERFIFFDLLVRGFTKRIASVISLYPWRL